MSLIFLLSVSCSMGCKLWEYRDFCFFSVIGTAPRMAPGLEQTCEWAHLWRQRINERVCGVGGGPV